jgi:ring-1,2-phenylacetyl-CoA epoxidase subunit PaaC
MMSPTSEPPAPHGIHDSVYDGLLSSDNDARWAYGTGFEDPLDGVDTRLPDGVDRQALAAFCLILGEDALIMSQTLQAWLTRLPELEEEAAIANIALDLLGQARLLLARAGLAEGRGRTEDSFAYERSAGEFRNVALVEAPDADFAGLIARLLAFSTWRLAIFECLREATDGVVSAVAKRGCNELRYHVDYAAGWVTRLGDGTDVSHTRMQSAIDAVWPFVLALVNALDAPAGLFPLPHPTSRVTFADDGTAVAFAVGANLQVHSDPTPDEREHLAARVAVRPSNPLGDVGGELLSRLSGMLFDATMTVPTGVLAGPGRGEHGPDFDALITDMQSVARALPGATW